jgi:hypothetical protein
MSPGGDLGSKASGSAEFGSKVSTGGESSLKVLDRWRNFHLRP